MLKLFHTCSIVGNIRQSNFKASDNMWQIYFKDYRPWIFLWFYIVCSFCLVTVCYNLPLLYSCISILLYSQYCIFWIVNNINWLIYFYTSLLYLFIFFSNWWLFLRSQRHWSHESLSLIAAFMIKKTEEIIFIRKLTNFFLIIYSFID